MAAPSFSYSYIATGGYVPTHRVAGAHGPPRDPRPRAGRRCRWPPGAAHRAPGETGGPVRGRLPADRLPAEQLPALADRRRVGVDPVPPDLAVGAPGERSAMGPRPHRRGAHDAAAVPGRRARRVERGDG